MFIACKLSSLCNFCNKGGISFGITLQTQLYIVFLLGVFARAFSLLSLISRLVFITSLLWNCLGTAGYLQSFVPFAYLAY